MNILDHISESLETIFWVKILKFFDSDADPDPGSGMEKFGSGINIPDSHHWANEAFFNYSKSKEPFTLPVHPDTVLQSRHLGWLS